MDLKANDYWPDKSLSSKKSAHSASQSIERKGLGIRSMKKSCSSLYLQGISESSHPPPTCGELRPTLQRQATSMSETSLSGKDAMNVVSNEPSHIAHWALVFFLAFQVPDLLKEIRFILDLHYHSFPLLIVLGSFHPFVKRPRNHPASQSDNCKISGSKLSRSSIGSEDSWQNVNLSDFEENSSMKVEREVSGVSEGDDWGYFADPDESSMLLGSNARLAVRGRRGRLPTLPEMEEED